MLLSKYLSDICSSGQEAIAYTNNKVTLLKQKSISLPVQKCYIKCTYNPDIQMMKSFNLWDTSNLPLVKFYLLLIYWISCVLLALKFGYQTIKEIQL